MKRLLVLVIVFAVTSAANAALTYYLDDAPAVTPLEIQTNEVITIQVYSSDTSNWLGYAVQQDTGVASTMVGWLSNGRSYYDTGTYIWYDEP
ncbi:MAG: hypothetical protein JSV99_02120, partial [Planctomycetota bacterium]